MKEYVFFRSPWTETYFYCQDDNVFLHQLHVDEDKTGFDNGNINFNQSALSHIFKTVVSGCVPYCFTGHNKLKLYSVNCLAMIPCFGIKSQTFADAILCLGSVNWEAL